MKNKLTHNLGLKLVSLLAAIGIWLFIVYTYDPADTVDFTLDVTILNEDAITSLNKVYEVIEGDTVTIRVKGNTSQINSLKASDFKATADISKLSPTYHASIDVVCTKTNNVEISFLGKINMLAIRLEDVAFKQFKVTVVPEGMVADGYYVGASTTKPNLIQVQGGESAIARIREIRAVVDVNGASEDIRTEAEIKAYDEYGQEIKTGSLTFSKNPVNVYTTIYGTKEVPVTVVAEGEPYSGYRLVNIEYEPKTIVLAGPEEVLNDVSEIRVPISVANRITSLEDTLLLADYLPDGVYLNDVTTSVNVMMEIERLSTKQYELSYEAVQLRNSNQSDWMYHLEQSGTFSVRVLGLADELNALEAVSLRPYVDVAELTEEGTYSLTVQYELEERFEVQGNTTVNVVVVARPNLPVDDPFGENGDSTGDEPNLPDVPGENEGTGTEPIPDDGKETGGSGEAGANNETGENRNESVHP